MTDAENEPGRPPWVDGTGDDQLPPNYPPPGYPPPGYVPPGYVPAGYYPPYAPAQGMADYVRLNWARYVTGG